MNSSSNQANVLPADSASASSVGHRPTNRNLAKLRSRMRGAAKRLQSLKAQRDDIQAIIKNRFLTIASTKKGTSTNRRLGDSEVREYRGKLADIKMQILAVNAEYQANKKSYSEAVDRLHASSKKQLKDRRVFYRALRLFKKVKKGLVKQILHFAQNGKRSEVETIKGEIAAGKAKKDIHSMIGNLMADTVIDGYEEVAASGIVHARLMDGLAREIAAVDLSVPA